MSDIFFSVMAIPAPDMNIGVGSGPHGRQTGEMLAGIEKILIEQRPEAVIVYGDPNSTLAGTLAASKLKIPIGHIEAGLRCFNRSMPEEQNRIVVDHLSSYLYCPTETARKNLLAEGIEAGVELTGDIMLDALI